MAIYATDTLEDTDAVLLINHTASDGSTWSEHANSTCYIAFTGTSRVFNKTGHGGSAGLCVNSATPAGLDQQVTLGLNCQSAAFTTGALLRQSHMIYYDDSTDLWKLNVVGTGIFPTTVSDPTRFVAGNTYTVIYKEVGNHITVNVDGTERAALDVTGGYILGTVGHCGIAFLSAQATNTGTHVTSFQSGDAAVPATSYTVTAPTVCCTGVATPSATGLRGGVAGVCKLTFTPSGGFLATDFTVSISDAAGGTFGTATIVAGDTSKVFTYTPAIEGAKTITVTETSANGFGVKTATTTVTDDAIVVDGNSLSDDIGAPVGVGVSWPRTLQTQIGTAYAVFDFAITGTTTPVLAGAFATNIKPTLDLVVGTKYLIISEMVNHISLTNPSPSAAVTWAAMVSYITAAAPSATAVMLLTGTPRTGAFAVLDGSQNTSGFNTRIADTNALARVDWGTVTGLKALVDVVIDVRAQDPTNTTYYVDGAHPSVALLTIIATQVEGAIACLSGGPTGGGGVSSTTSRARVVIFN